MAKLQNQKAKILYLEKMIRETGENHVITLQEILEELAKHDIRAERKSIYDDFAVLRTFGLDVRFRRGRDSGYYLAGQYVENTVVTERTSEDISVQENVETCTEDSDERTEKMVQESFASGKTWTFEREDASETDGIRKQMKLLFKKEKENDIRAYFGEFDDYKEKGEDMYTCCVTYASDPQFFGWLTAMGKDVRILKPKKLAQSYRDYLKMIAKAYK